MTQFFFRAGRIALYTAGALTPLTLTRFLTELISAIGYNLTNLPENVLNQIGSLDPTGIVASLFTEEN